ncbi:YicC family protein [Dasania sp. GY-MA-18]|uniref:YicC family protein n=1 Tax=Dasania phycosphaerae TaxID=2950436 RepID=A0A9J6RPD7_9GAMM|nr:MULTISPECIES: YicC/YloC family endoribonuclease [Dasania]MCR8923768.1 YicC family protein [Dasania sp. GY-MA-18]MCZ0866202.1 YicC family protein [Dasania phycosphaerae]MCZ0869926.1 YicC family protein [Dasania phycosphaerae]
MIRSMTAFARHSSQQDWGSLVWELRSVNHRYLEPSLKLPEAMRALEPAMRDKLRKQLSRGKVECGLRLHIQSQHASEQLNINQSLLAQVISASEAIQQQLQQPAPLDALQLMQWPGVLEESTLDNDALQQQALEAFQIALTQLNESREREGAELKQIIVQRLDAIDAITASVREQMPQILAAQKTKIQERMAELAAELNPERVEQEIVLLAQKADVDEELDRLVTHVNEVRRVLKKGGACGRRLDFLMQELNREANTLSSKAIVSDSTQAAVELKVLIEQMREQIQNIE